MAARGISNPGNASNGFGFRVVRSAVGTHATDFVFGALGSTSLAPGASTNFTVTFKGKQAMDIKVVKKPAKSIAPGKSTRFKVIYKPLAEKSSNTKMRIRSNDKDEDPFRVNLTGKGTR